jgi:hypothetical protein
MLGWYLAKSVESTGDCRNTQACQRRVVSCRVVSQRGCAGLPGTGGRTRAVGGCSEATTRTHNHRAPPRYRSRSPNTTPRSGPCPASCQVSEQEATTCSRVSKCHATPSHRGERARGCGDLGGPREIGHGAVFAHRLVEQSHLVPHLLAHVKVTAVRTQIFSQHQINKR